MRRIHGAWNIMLQQKVEHVDHMVGKKKVMEKEELRGERNSVKKLETLEEG